MDFPPRPNLVRFGAFELDLRARELRKAGLNTGVPEQSIKILALLLDKPGEVVLREEIRKKLWPNDTVVEFDHSINAAIKRLRQALGDPAEEPQYIETLARRGYRWKIRIEWVGAPPNTAGLADKEVQSAIPSAVNLIGKKVSHYRVLDVLGGGGMGMVFKAEDLKLGRRVALKFLPEETMNDPATLKRFEQEARTASALNHPNICTIHEIEEHEGQPFIVMEMLDGDTLRELLAAVKSARTLMPLEQVLELSLQIVRGLEAAHQKGIIHRDIKPANVFVTNQGQAKILDFGLAKLIPAFGGAEDHAGNDHRNGDLPVPHGKARSAPTSDLLLSRTGVAMGTAGYMSPEQVRGQKLDARTDLFSLGLVLYEMVSGERAFSCATSSGLQDAILHGTPTPIRNANPEIPLKFQDIIAKALEKDRELRYQTASEIYSDLLSLRPNLRPRPRITWWPQIAAAVIMVLVVSGAILWVGNRRIPVSRATPDLQLRQLTINSDENPVRNGTISPDGSYLAYSDSKGIHIKLIQRGEIRNLTPLEPIHGGQVDWLVGPWFPDSTRFLVTASPPPESPDIHTFNGQHRSVWTASVLGGMLRELQDEGSAEAVSPDGSLIAFTKNYTRDGAHELWIMGASGEQPRKLYTAGDKGFNRFQWSPDGQRLSYVEADQNGVTVKSRDLNGGRPATMLSVAHGNILHDYLWSSDGRFIFGLEEPGNQVQSCNFWEMRVDTRTGLASEKPRRLTNWSGFCLARPSMSADRKKLAFLKWTETQVSVYVAAVDAGGLRIIAPKRLTLEEGWNSPSGWTNDSKTVIFRTFHDGKWGIYKQSLSADTAEPIVTGLNRVSQHTPVSPDGKWLLYSEWITPGDPNSPVNAMRISLSGGAPELIIPGQHFGVRCATPPVMLCTAGGIGSDSREMVFFAFDPVKGLGRELARFNTRSDNENFGWVLAADGTRIVVFETTPARLHVLPLDGGRTQEIDVQGWSNLDDVEWAADGRGFYGSSRTPRGSVLLHVDLHGNVRVLWEQRGSEATGGIPSPDGQHIAMLGTSQNHNVWMIDNF